MFHFVPKTLGIILKINFRYLLVSAFSLPGQLALYLGNSNGQAEFKSPGSPFNAKPEKAVVCRFQSLADLIAFCALCLFWWTNVWD